MMQECKVEIINIDINPISFYSNPMVYMRDLTHSNSSFLLSYKGYIHSCCSEELVAQGG